MTLRVRYSEKDLAQLIKNRDRDHIESVRGGVAASNKPHENRLPSPPRRAGVAQSAEQRVRNSPVAGATPVASSKYKSKLEAAFAAKLDLEMRARFFTGLLGWWYERVNVRLPGKKNFYKPDFLVQRVDGLTFYDTKGKNKSDDRSLVKIKTAAGLNPWARFIQVRCLSGVWEERLIQ